MGMTRTASRIIAKYGQTAMIERPGAAPSTPWDPPAGSPTFYAVTVAVGKYELDSLSGTLIQSDDRRVFLSVEGLTIVPTLSDKLVIGDDTFTLISIHPLAPDGTARFYELQARA
jgi:hypothetical protein